MYKFVILIAVLGTIFVSHADSKQPLTCRANEEARCVKDCPPEKTCENRDIQYQCKDDDKPCQKKCVCKNSYYRNSIGQCIPKESCAICNRVNEHYECGSACQTTCATLGEPCLIINVRCNDACYCNPGFARDSSGKCIPIRECQNQ